MRQRHHNHHQRRMARWSASLSVAVVWLLSAQIACAGQALDATLTTVPASAPCSSYDSCGACTSAAADGGCGWCSSSQPGHQSGHGSCLPKASGAASCTSPAVWSTTALECSVARCAAVAACDECVAGGGGSCGWCATTGRCLYGSVDGPQPPSGTCPAANDDSSPWRWRTCSHTCAAEQSCVSCTDHSSCGWCVLESRCKDGAKGGSVDGTCSQTGWAWDGVDCCGQYSDCSDCTSQPACGWCDGGCYSGTLLGPNAGVACPHGDWDYSGSCSSSGTGPFLVVLAVLAPMFVVGAVVSLYTRYCSPKQRRRRRARRALSQYAPPVDVPVNAGGSSADYGSGSVVSDSSLDAPSPLSSSLVPLVANSRRSGTLQRQPSVPEYGESGFTFDHHPAFAPPPTSAAVENPPVNSYL